MARGSAAYWQRIANERLRALWIAAHANGGTLRIGPSAAQEYPGDDRAEVLTHTDPQFGDFVIQARRARGQHAPAAKEDR
jgi:hypothetical protein